MIQIEAWTASTPSNDQSFKDPRASTLPPLPRLPPARDAAAPAVRTPSLFPFFPSPLFSFFRREHRHPARRALGPAPRSPPPSSSLARVACSRRPSRPPSPAPAATARSGVREEGAARPCRKAPWLKRAPPARVRHTFPATAGRVPPAHPLSLPPLWRRPLHGRSTRGSWGARPGASEPRPDLGAAHLERRRRQGEDEVEAAGRCTGGPPAAEQTPRPPAPSLPVGGAPSCCAPRGRVPRPPGARGCDQLPRTARLARSVPLGPRAPPAGVAAGGATST